MYWGLRFTTNEERFLETAQLRSTAVQFRSLNLGESIEHILRFNCI